MKEWLHLLIDRHPRRALILGKAVFLAGSIAVLAAVFARAELQSINADRVAAGQSALLTLAQALPQLPTALVPEGPVGFAIAGVLVVVGTLVTALADKAVKRNRRS